MGRMTEDTIIEYSYVMLEDYKDLEDGTPNFHHNPAIKVSAQGTILRFLELLSYNSKLEGISIVDINFKPIQEETQND
jgi:hypothetical protein